ncbi:MAG: hypothetical protein HC901_02625, partial [Bdellovibrionaceae bacterium]|nr:hypothetical protein [Pseudobdellovibrionaceae bacterium]
MTLLAEIQSVLERTYGHTGLDLEACLIGPARSASSAPRCRSRNNPLRLATRSCVSTTA